jgi:hypothetical protein
MNTVSAAGLVVALAGIGGYLAGLAVPYPGRAFSLTALMTGATMLAVGRSEAGGDEP